MENSPKIKKAFELYMAEKGAGDPHAAEETLSLYLEGLLTGKKKESMEDHLSRCRECLDLFLALKEMELSPPVAPQEIPLPSWREKLSEIVSSQSLYIGVKTIQEKLEILYTSGEVLTPLASPLGVRGAPPVTGSPLVTVQKQFSSLQVEVEVEQVRGNEKEVKVVLTDRWTKEPKEGLVVNLMLQDRIMASYMARAGEILFKHLAAGKYHLKIFDRQNLAGLIILDIKGESHEK